MRDHDQTKSYFASLPASRVSSQIVQAELVEVLSFALAAAPKKGQAFDRLRQNGLGVRVMPKIDLNAIEQINRTGYPAPYNEPMSKRHYRRLAPALDLEDFGVSHVVLEPGGISSQRHWHEGEDEFLVMLDGEGTLIEEDGETVLQPGDCAAWPKGVANGHHIVNRTDQACTFIVVGKPAASDCHYPDIDLHLPGGGPDYTRKDGGKIG